MFRVLSGFVGGRDILLGSLLTPVRAVCDCDLS
jgi:hypothetical protein